MHIYNWYHSDVTSIHYVHEYIIVNYRAIPLLFAFPISLFPFAPHLSPLTYLEPSLLWQDPSSSFPVCSWTDLPISLPLFIYPSSQNPDPPGFPRSKYTFIRTTSRIWLTRSSTKVMQHTYYFWMHQILDCLDFLRTYSNPKYHTPYMNLILAFHLCYNIKL